MTKEEFVKTFLEGAALAPQDALVRSLVGIVYDLRKTTSIQAEHIDYMDDVARDNTISVTCRSCRESFEPDCELSEISHEGNYCGKNQWCCP